MAQQASATDPFALWREWISQSERQWNAFLNDTMGTEQFAQSLGGMMDVYLAIQKGLNEAMGRYLSAINVPTRDDIVALGDRLSGIEARLGDLETKLDIAQRAAEAAGPAPAMPPRTRKPGANPDSLAP
jgi:polyhydroxyalkanoic acid synthase PhaR subunit